ncbi:hemerythrin domain-containing protein [Sphingomonas sp. Leaf357]|uniref:hemerythrin domain-containing protein n=1 Tax=Sphingomonas sp. Leaf357 TaxID=1736350 RepID=UPI000A5C162A|nr:hemerythrin domain-containing protein [Sphingomonas sp. Leaf357]
MADHKDNLGARDQATVSKKETYEVDYFAKKHGLTREETVALIDRVGNSREALEAAVATASTTEPKRRVRTAKASSSSSATAKRTRASLGTRKRTAAATPSSVGQTLAAVATPVTAAVEAVTEPVAKVVSPAIDSIAGAPRKMARVGSRRTASARKKVAAAPKATIKRAGAAADGVKAAVSGRTASIMGAAAAGLVTGLVVNLGRKMAVQAPSALAGDWLDALKVEHRLALALFDKLQATGSDETGKRTILLTQLKHALGKHAFTEENVIYPALRAWGDKADADKLNHDHGYVKQNLYDLEEMDNASPAFMQKVSSFRAELEDHIREEEEAIFPPLHAALGEVGNARVTAQANKEGFKLA